MLVNNLEHILLRNCMKPDNGNESISISDKVNDSVDDPDTILQTCFTLKTLVDRLLNQVNGLVSRVVHLENEVTEVKALVRRLEHRHDRDEIIDDHTVNTETQLPEASDRMVAGMSQTDPAGKQLKTSDNNSNVLNRILPENVKLTPTAPPLNHIEGVLYAAQPTMPKSFKLHAASVCTDSAESPVYVGKLRKDTIENNVKEHLCQIGISPNHISEISKLKSKNNNQSSFRIDLKSEDAVKVSLLVDNWPKGVQVQWFNPRENTSQQTTERPLRVSRSKQRHVKPRHQRKYRPRPPYYYEWNDFSAYSDYPPQNVNYEYTSNSRVHDDYYSADQDFYWRY